MGPTGCPETSVKITTTLRVITHNNAVLSFLEVSETHLTYRSSNRPYGRVDGSDEIRTAIQEDWKCAGFTQINTETLLCYGFVIDIKLLQRISGSTEALNKTGVLCRQNVWTETLETSKIFLTLIK